MNTMKNSRQEFRFTSDDGLQIACNRWPSRMAARGVFQVKHSFPSTIRDAKHRSEI
jgi:hypothetical protein